MAREEYSVVEALDLLGELTEGQTQHLVRKASRELRRQYNTAMAARQLANQVIAERNHIGGDLQKMALDMLIATGGYPRWMHDQGLVVDGKFRNDKYGEA